MGWWVAERLLRWVWLMLREQFGLQLAPHVETIPQPFFFLLLKVLEAARSDPMLQIGN